MSVDLGIAPRRAADVTWASLRRQWQQRLGDARAGMLGPTPQLCRIGATTPVAEDDRLVPPSHYSFNLAVPCTLSLSIMENGPDLDETLYLEDYGRNLDAAMLAELAEQWGRVGHNYEISSGGGHSKVEPELFIALACALADLCDGLPTLAAVPRAEPFLAPALGLRRPRFSRVTGGLARDARQCHSRDCTIAHRTPAPALARARRRPANARPGTRADQIVTRRLAPEHS